MLTREQIYTMLILRQRGDNFFSKLPNETIEYISHFVDSDINKALRIAAYSMEEVIDKIVSMVRANPRILLKAGNVLAQGGVEESRITLYEFFLAECHFKAAKAIEFGFELIPNGENERQRQYERYKSHIDVLEKSIQEKMPAYDLKPLFDIIISSPSDDINEALNLADPNLLSIRNTPLRAALVKFRKAVETERKPAGLHYKHYTTLQQALDLLYTADLFPDSDKSMEGFYESNEFNDADPSKTRHYDKCRLVLWQIIGYLQRGLPAVDRRFLACFTAEEEVRYKPTFRFPKTVSDAQDDDLAISGLGFNDAIFGHSTTLLSVDLEFAWLLVLGAKAGWCGRKWESHIEEKMSDYKTLLAAKTHLKSFSP